MMDLRNVFAAAALSAFVAPAAACGVCIEDKLFPKTNSFIRGTAQPLADMHEFAGKIRAIGGGMATRARAMPDLPTLQEQGLAGFECYTWNAIVAPANPAPTTR